tara:strand:+ start:1570 stop:2718 length:1149 start_codon:yes stop_codon:yes gene_type:complete
VGRGIATLENLVNDPAQIGLDDPFAGGWHKRRVLITGHTGFKGAWLTLWLAELGAEITGISLPGSVSEPNLYELASLYGSCRDLRLDINDVESLVTAVREARPEVIIHLAAQSLVRRGYANPSNTYLTNVMGTMNILQALRGVDSVEAVLIVTSDKCYRRGEEEDHFFSEDDPLGGSDPYSASKAAAEMVVSGVKGLAGLPPIATARSGNVIGGGDWGEDRLISDLARALVDEEGAVIRRPTDVRPWQHALDCLGGYLLLMHRLSSEPGVAGPFNFGPDGVEDMTVGELADQFVAKAGGKPWRDASVNQASAPQEAPWLRLSNRRACERLGWAPVLDTATAVDWSAEWHCRMISGEQPGQLCQEFISRYVTAARQTGVAWAA